MSSFLQLTIKYPHFLPFFLDKKAVCIRIKKRHFSQKPSFLRRADLFTLQPTNQPFFNPENTANQSTHKRHPRPPYTSLFLYVRKKMRKLCVRGWSAMGGGACFFRALGWDVWYCFVSLAVCFGFLVILDYNFNKTLTVLRV